MDAASQAQAKMLYWQTVFMYGASLKYRYHLPPAPV